MIVPESEYYLGWVIQPMDVFQTQFYVYERDDSFGPKGQVIRGTRVDAMEFIERRTKRK